MRTVLSPIAAARPQVPAATLPGPGCENLPAVRLVTARELLCALPWLPSGARDLAGLPSTAAQPPAAAKQPPAGRPRGGPPHAATRRRTGRLRRWATTGQAAAGTPAATAARLPRNALAARAAVSAPLARATWPLPLPANPQPG